METAASTNSESYQQALPIKLKDVRGNEMLASNAEAGSVAPPSSPFGLTAPAPATILPSEVVAAAHDDPEPVKPERKGSLVLLSL